MSKARARERAKARAAGKTKKRESDENPIQKNTPEKFTGEGHSIKGPTVKAGGGNFSRTGRGSARSG